MWLPLVGPLPKPPGSATARSCSTSSASDCSRRCSPTSSSGPARCSIRLRAGRGELGYQPARRPGRGRQRDDDLDRHGHARPLHLAVPARRQPQRREAGPDRARRVAGRRSRSDPRGTGGRRRPGRSSARAHPRRQRTGRVGQNRFLYALVLRGRSASLGVEIAAARLMAPFFGASTIIWANTIGVVLVALSIGYWLGGGFADRCPERAQPLRRGDGRGAAARAGSARLAAVLRPLGRRARSDRGGRVRRLAVRGAVSDRDSGGPPRHLLAMGDPARGRRRRALRRVAGRLYAISTVGSLTRHDARGAGPDPVRRHSAHLPGLLARARGRRGDRARLAGFAVAPARGSRRRSRCPSAR